MRISILALGRRNNGVSQQRRVTHCLAANTLQKQNKKKVPSQRSKENERKRKKEKVLGQRSEENKGKKKVTPHSWLHVLGTMIKAIDQPCLDYTLSQPTLRWEGDA